MTVYKIKGTISSLKIKESGKCTLTINGEQGFQFDLQSIVPVGKKKNAWVDEQSEGAKFYELNKKVLVPTNLQNVILRIYNNKQSSIFEVEIKAEKSKELLKLISVEQKQ